MRREPVSRPNSARSAIFVKVGRLFQAASHNLSYNRPMIELPAVITSTAGPGQACAQLSPQPLSRSIPNSCARPPIGPSCASSSFQAGALRSPSIRSRARPSSFYGLMANEAVVKVFHAARQDSRSCIRKRASSPARSSTRQIAAMALGHGEAISYGALVKKLLKRTHDKTYQSIDWCVRPLGPRQIEYALGDVTLPARRLHQAQAAPGGNGPRILARRRGRDPRPIPRPMPSTPRTPGSA